MSNLFSLGATYSDLFLNAVFRGSVGTPPSTVYFSMGQPGSTTVPAEMSGVTRTPVRVNRGWIAGTDSQNYQFQSTGTLAGVAYMQAVVDVYCTIDPFSYTGASPNQLCGMLWDAAVGGNLLAVFEQSGALLVNVTDGDIVRWGRGMRTASVDASGNVSDDNPMPLIKLGGNSQTQLGSYMYSLLVDWLFRGFDSMNQLFSPASFPNLYACITDAGGAVQTNIPRLAIPRSTGQWSAPADAHPGTTLERKISNVNTLTFAAATGAGSLVNPYLAFKMASTPQSFVDTVYAIRFPSLNYNAGDVIQIAASSLDIVVN